MTEREKILVWFNMSEISCKKQETLFELIEDFSMKAILSDGQIVDVLSTEEYHRLAKTANETDLDEIVANLQKAGIQILTIESENFPEKLKLLPDRPYVLYAKGDLSLLEDKALAIVGTRKPSNYGKIVTEKLAGGVARAGVVIISGLAYGVDSISHRRALDENGKTIAVLGGGFNHVYPSSNTNLADEIAQKGLLITEYLPSVKPTKFSFPRRNRIIAALADGVLITEAGIKSGTIHTKEYALEYGKYLFAVPGNITSSNSELTNMIIKTGQAECVLSSDDILQTLGVNATKEKQKFIAFSIEEKMIVDLLSDGEKDFEFLLAKTKIPTNILNSHLTTLEIRGLIEKLPAQTFALK